MFYTFIILYLLLYIILFSIIFKQNNKCYYYKCIIHTHYHLNEDVIPLCSIDIKYKLINYYGYFLNRSNGNYIYQSKSLYIHNYTNSIFDKKVNISVRRYVIKKKEISLCLVGIYAKLNIINIIRTCLVYRKLGIEHVSLYISFYDSKYKKYYDWFKTRNWIEIIHFILPNISTYLYGQDSKLNHCINHYRYISDYVVITDVDEIIFPQQRVYLLDILEKYGKYNYVFSFKSVLFNVENINSSVFSTKRTGCLIESGYEKMILRPEKIKSIGAHFPKVWQEKGKIIFVKSKDAYVRHARIKTGSKMLAKVNCNNVNEIEYLPHLKKMIEYYIKWI